MNPKATVAFVPREVFSTTERVLETLYERTTGPFDLVCVDGGSPPQVRDYLQRAALKYDFTLLRSESYLTPNQSRNLAVRYTNSPYVVFVDNDAIVGQNWLEPLVECAEETGAWVVGPLYFEHAPEQHRLHMVGGECRVETDSAGRRFYRERHHLAHRALSEVEQPIERQETELIEFHTVLVAMEAFEKLGPLDEDLLCQTEHGDLCLLVRQAGKKVYIEPRSKITYIPPRRLEPSDREFFNLRWSEAWSNASVGRLAEKWNLDPGHPELHNLVQWVRKHRRFGVRGWPTVRKLLGRKLTSSVQKRIFNPFEEAANRRRYPQGEFGSVRDPKIKLIHAANGANSVAA